MRMVVPHRAEGSRLDRVIDGAVSNVILKDIERLCSQTLDTPVLSEQHSEGQHGAWLF